MVRFHRFSECVLCGVCLCADADIRSHLALLLLSGKGGARLCVGVPRAHPPAALAAWSDASAGVYPEGGAACASVYTRALWQYGDGVILPRFLVRLGTRCIRWMVRRAWVYPLSDARSNGDDRDRLGARYGDDLYVCVGGSDGAARVGGDSPPRRLVCAGHEYCVYCGIDYVLDERCIVLTGDVSIERTAA